MAEPICLNCPKEYWIAFVLESQGEEELAADLAQIAITADGLEPFACFPVSDFEENADPLSLVQNVVWLDAQGIATNDVTIEYYLFQDIKVHVSLHEEPAYRKVLP